MTDVAADGVDLREHAIRAAVAEEFLIAAIRWESSVEPHGSGPIATAHRQPG